jgi:hypothetical protein
MNELVGLSAYQARMAVVWDSGNLFQVPFAESIGLGIQQPDAQTLDLLGLPSWAAPHIWLQAPKKFAEGIIRLGQDADERPILYRSETREVFVNAGVEADLFVSCGILDFLASLLDLVELIERGIESHGPNSYSEGNFPPELIHDFWHKIETRLGVESAARSVWHAEMIRLSRRIT